MPDATTLRRMRANRPKTSITLPGQVRQIEPSDGLLPVHQLATESSGKRPSPTSIWRWCHGIGGSRGKRRDTMLPAVLLGGTWLTSRETWLSWLQVRTAERLARSTVIDGDIGLVD